MYKVDKIVLILFIGFIISSFLFFSIIILFKNDWALLFVLISCGFALVFLSLPKSMNNDRIKDENEVYYQRMQNLGKG